MLPKLKLNLVVEKVSPQKQICRIKKESFNHLIDSSFGKEFLQNARNRRCLPSLAVAESELDRMLFWRSPTQYFRQELSVQTQFPAHWPELLQMALRPTGPHFRWASRHESCSSEQHWQKWIALSLLQKPDLPNFSWFNWSCSSQFSAQPDAVHCVDDDELTVLFNELMKFRVLISETNSGLAAARASLILNFFRLSMISSRKRSPAALLGTPLSCLPSWMLPFLSLTAFSTLIDLKPLRSSFINKLLARSALISFNGPFARMPPATLKGRESLY